MSRGRPFRGTKDIHICIPQVLYDKLTLLKPELMDPASPNKLRYGGLAKYLSTLIERDLEIQERGIK